MVLTAVLICAAVLIVPLFLPMELDVSFSNGKREIVPKIGTVTLRKKTKTRQNAQSAEKQRQGFEKKLKGATRNIKSFCAAKKTAAALCKRYVRVKNPHLEIQLGTGDAALTAICTGAMWAATAGFFALIGTISRMDKPKTDIQPVYNEACFRYDGGCIICARIGYIILIMLCTLRKLKPEKGREE